MKISANISYAILLLYALASCSDSGNKFPGSDPVEIVAVSTGLGPAPATETRKAKTRGMETGISTESIISDGPLPLSVVRIDQSGLPDESYLPYTATNTDGIGQAPRPATLAGYNSALRMTFRSTEFFLSGEAYNNTKLIGWYPPGSTWTVSNEGVATIDFTVDGQTDILMSNLVEGNKANKYDTPTNTLAFEHLLTRFRVRVFTTSQDTTDEWGNVESITLRGKAQTCLVTLPGVDAETNTRPTEIKFSGSDALPIIYSNPDTPLSIPVVTGEVGDDGFIIGTALAGTAMVAPEATKITLDVVCTNKSGYLDIAPPQGGFKAGTSYTLTLEFGEPPLILLSGVTINEWNKAEEENQTVN